MVVLSDLPVWRTFPGAAAGMISPFSGVADEPTKYPLPSDQPPTIVPSKSDADAVGSIPVSASAQMAATPLIQRFMCYSFVESDRDIETCSP